MKILSIPALSIAALTAAFSITSAQAQKKGDDATGIVLASRYSQADQAVDMTGSLRKGFKKVPFKMSMVPEMKMIRFRFNDPVQIISLTLDPNRYELTEQLAGQKAKPLDQKRYGEKIHGTDVTYEDISQRFLYWPKPKIQGEDKLIKRQRDCWIVRLDNPRPGFGPYHVVLAWIDKENSALLKVEGYDSKGRIIKRFEVSNVQKDRKAGVWVLEAMSVETIDPDGKRKSDTTMSLSKPVLRK